MTVEEIENYAELGKWACVCVDFRELPEYPNYIRTVIFSGNNQVCVEFYPLVPDVHTSFLEYCGEFRSVKEAVHEIEIFLKKPINDWTNYNKTGNYPIYVDKDSTSSVSNESIQRLRTDAAFKKIDLPKKGNFKLNRKIHFLSKESYERFLNELDDIDKELYKQAQLTYGVNY